MIVNYVAFLAVEVLRISGEMLYRQCASMIKQVLLVLGEIIIYCFSRCRFRCFL